MPPLICRYISPNNLLFEVTRNFKGIKALVYSGGLPYKESRHEGKINSFGHCPLPLLF